MKDQPRTTGETIRWFANCTPDAPAIQAAGCLPLTYAALVEFLDRFRMTLNRWGIGRGDRVALFSPNSTTMALSLLGIQDCATAVPIDAGLEPERLEKLLYDASVKALIVDEGCNNGVRSVAQSMGLTVIRLLPEETLKTGVFFLEDCCTPTSSYSAMAAVSDIALILQTAGTTSGAKLVPLNHTNITDRAIKKARWLNLQASDRTISFMPMHHGHGLSMGLTVPLVVGSSVLYMPEFDVAEFYTLLDIHQPTWYSASPTYHQAILSRAEEYRDIILRSELRTIVSSSGALSASVLLALENTFRASVVETFDLSEAGTLAGRPMSEMERKLGTFGKAFPDTVAIMDAAGKSLVPGEIGEIITRGPSVFSGYENNPEANADAFLGEWFRTGDLGSLDADGYLSLNGRAKEIINRGGENIAPQEIEEVLMMHADIEEAVAFPIPHSSLGEIVGAAVIPKKDMNPTRQELKRFMLERLAPYKVPPSLLVVDEIPKGTAGKVQRNKLAALFGFT